uniref:G2/mitotic-specific cyclin-B3 n=1 Tax=Panagrellus redivivus TaxID=6233 RepID=A0A7E4VJQ1_PANRE
MMLRNRNKNNENAAPAAAAAIRPRNMNAQQPDAAPLKGEKRVIDATKPGVDATEPQAKRVAMNDISKVFSNVVLDSTKKPTDQKARKGASSNRAMSVIAENSENVEPSSPARVDPCPDYDYDAECGKDTLQVGEYANEIFTYYRHRMPLFKIGKYMEHQTNINPQMRAALINWMVSIQEQFELNHETLYLAVKVVDIYLDRTNQKIVRSDLQLIGGTAMFLASKYDERLAPLIDDINYLCDDTYTKQQVIRMELILFKAVGFDLGIPLSYRFLRRFSRVIKSDMHTLTLARYILESSLLFYEFVTVKDDILAAAALLLALRMKRRDWDARLTKYTTYTLEEVEPLSWMLNHMIYKRKTQYAEFQTIHLKYSHNVFFHVAATPSLPDKFHPRAAITIPTNVINQ